MNFANLVPAVLLLSMAAVSAQECPSGYYDTGSACPCYPGQFCMGAFCCAPGNPPQTTPPATAPPATAPPATAPPATAPPATTSNPDDELTMDDLQGLQAFVQILNQTNAVALETTEYGEIPYKKIAKSAAKALIQIGKTFGKIARKKKKTNKVKQAYGQLTSEIYDGFYLLNQELNKIKAFIKIDNIATAYYQDRQNILDLGASFQAYMQNPNSDWYENEFNRGCNCPDNCDMYSTINNINNLLTNDNGSACWTLAKTYDRDNYDGFMHLVFSDLISASTMQLACMGEQNATESDMQLVINQMQQWVEQTAKQLEAGDTYIANNFLDGEFGAKNVSINRIMTAYNECPKGDLQCVSDKVHYTLQSKFVWLYWTQFMAVQNDFWWQTKVYQSGNYSKFGAFIIDNRDIGGRQISIYSLKKPPSDPNWKSSAMDYIYDYANGCCTCGTKHCHTDKFHHCTNGLINTLNCQWSGISNVIYYNTYLLQAFIMSESCDSIQGPYKETLGAVTSSGGYCVWTGIDSSNDNPDTIWAGIYCFYDWY